MSSPSKAVLITGCSTGIGAETARHLTAEGWTVYATARRPETLSGLAEAGCKTLALDVTDEASMRAATDQVIELVAVAEDRSRHDVAPAAVTGRTISPPRGTRDEAGRG